VSRHTAHDHAMIDHAKWRGRITWSDREGNHHTGRLITWRPTKRHSATRETWARCQHEDGTTSLVPITLIDAPEHITKATT